METSNIFIIITTLATATRALMTRTTIADKARKLRSSHTVTIYTITIATIGDIAGILYIITTITLITSATSVYNTIVLMDTGAATLESEVIPIDIIITILVITQITIQIIQILVTDNIPLIKRGLVE